MTRMKKVLLLGTMVLTIGATTATAFAAAPVTTTGSIDAASLEELKAQRLELKKEILSDRVESGLITQDQADEFITQMEERQAVCDGTGSAGMGRRLGAGMGGNGQGRGQGQGFGMGGCGNFNQTE